LISPLKGYLAEGIGKDAAALFDNPIDTHDSMWAKFISGTPLAENIGTRPALNFFGEPVERTFQDRLRFLGRFWTERVNDPAWNWIASNNYVLPDFDDKLKTISSYQKESRAAKFGAAAAGVLTDEEQYEIVKRAGPRMKQVVTNYANSYGKSGFRQDIQEALNRDLREIYKSEEMAVVFGQ